MSRRAQSRVVGNRPCVAILAHRLSRLDFEVSRHYAGSQTVGTGGTPSRSRCFSQTFSEEPHMKSSWAKLLCRLLMVLMIWSPVQFAQAGMIGTDQIVTAASQTDRTTVLEFLGRADVATQLQSLGLDAKSATERVAAMTDSEVQMLAGKINSMPAGADSTGVILLLLIVGAAVWWIWFRR
ncbi:MAG TPA: PA2779 family protein [Burkholderiales bacterium]|nr:PA2779 family protein [Burkholderiales bacterium]